ncbi:uncharacterized protein LOC8282892 [Ricinus communis]|uniref:Uncharacterized protein n=1 Tax=Ricinus communis TaxID=3988 RepID=B9SAC5_RICCO|nr:uncharacterized protein LOC8282892 [Ricinus communis]EEF39374.1 conserved hypothetical protein [Ricinus communis]|eukprot:XP_002522944.1 uncharacterized protein LOC8282892 [Ricinus communis]
MGNCLRRESSMQWGGDDWGSPAPEVQLFSSSTRHVRQENITNIEEKGLLIGDNKGTTISPTSAAAAGATTSSCRELKIKITKKQLEELLGRVDMNELSIEQVLVQLVKVSDSSFETHRRSWRPNLQSIPE